MRKSSFLSLLVLGLLAAACSKSSDSSSSSTGKVKLQMANASSQIYSLDPQVLVRSGCPSGFSCISPTKFEMKILAAYVVEDVDPNTSNNVGQVGMVWLNPACESINNCKPSMVDYSDLTDPTAFNAALNSQALAIPTGTYRYVRLEFCQGAADADNVRITNGASVKEFTYGGCGTTSVALSSPVSVTEGSSLSIDVSYNLNDGEAYYTGSAGCLSASDFCLGSIELVPSIVQ